MSELKSSARISAAEARAMLGRTLPKEDVLELLYERIRSTIADGKFELGPCAIRECCRNASLDASLWAFQELRDEGYTVEQSLSDLFGETRLPSRVRW